MQTEIKFKPLSLKQKIQMYLEEVAETSTYLPKWQEIARLRSFDWYKPLSIKRTYYAVIKDAYNRGLDREIVEYACSARMRREAQEQESIFFQVFGIILSCIVIGYIIYLIF